MRHLRIVSHVLSVLSIPLALAAVTVPAAEAVGTNYQTGFIRWRADNGGLGGWQRSGVSLASNGTARLDPATAASGHDPYPAGSYNGGNFYNGGAFLVGEMVSPVMPTSFGFLEAIASWNVETPTGTWIETQIQARVGDRWTKWYNLGVWAADYSTIRRHAVRGQGDKDGFVAIDTLILTDKQAPATAFQLKLRLFRAADATRVTPTVRNISLAVSTAPGTARSLTPGNPARWNRTLAVPECSQMVYPDGGQVWCSPTSTAMVLGYWERRPGDCEPRVRAAVEGVFDWIYDGHGNWPFNTAYAASLGLEAYVARFTSLSQAEEWIAAGVPVVISYAWNNGNLTGAPLPKSDGHLAVLVGFDAAGNPVINDPAAASNEEVQRTYPRGEIERLWLENSGGTVYLIYPAGWQVPAL